MQEITNEKRETTEGMISRTEGMQEQLSGCKEQEERMQRSTGLIQEIIRWMRGTRRRRARNNLKRFNEELDRCKK
jgi:hypothetical protein